MDALVDTDAIFCYQCVRKMNEAAHVVVEIVRHTNVGYLDPESGTQCVLYGVLYAVRSCCESVWLSYFNISHSGLCLLLYVCLLFYTHYTTSTPYTTAGLNSSDIDYKFTPQFASGALFATSLLDTLVCQVCGVGYMYCMYYCVVFICSAYLLLKSKFDVDSAT